MQDRDVKIKFWVKKIILKIWIKKQEMKDGDKMSKVFFVDEASDRGRSFIEQNRPIILKYQG